MFSLGEVIALMAFGGALVMGGVFAGGWMAFKFKNAVQGENFFGGVPKGEVFTMKDEIDALTVTMKDEIDALTGSVENESEKSVLARTEQFLKTLGG